MNIFDQVTVDIKEAMKARNKVRLESLRNLKKLLLEAKTAPGANDEVSNEVALKLVQKLVKQGRDSAQIYTEQGRTDLATCELEQVSELEGYLPKQLSEEELETALRAIIAELGATSPQEMGKVMSAATARLGGQADGRQISTCVKNLLTP